MVSRWLCQSCLADASSSGSNHCQQGRHATVVLHEFPTAKYTQYIDLKGQETQSKQKNVDLNKEQLDVDNQDFRLKQKEDEHSLHMDRERAKLEDHLAKRRRFDASR